MLAAHLAAHPLLLVPLNPELLAEREKGFLHKEVKAWDKRLTSLAGGAMILSWLIAGLDSRWQWTGPIPLGYHLGGLLFTILGYTLFMAAMAANAFFAEGVRIQTERGHTVATGGPYRYVRHPGYAGTILAHLATPFLLGSLWALIPAFILIKEEKLHFLALFSLEEMPVFPLNEYILAGLFVGRTYLEDKTLQAELPGYIEYTRQTCFRLLPGVW